MHDYGAEVFIEEVQCYDDILYRCIVFSISYFVGALIIKMNHLMAVGIWIWGSSFLFPQASIPVNSGWQGLLAIGLRPLFVALKAAVGVFSLGVLKAHTC